MASDHGSIHSPWEEQTGGSQSTKRSPSPLFYGEDEVEETIGETSNKRSKTEHITTSAPLSPVDVELIEDTTMENTVTQPPLSAVDVELTETTKIRQTATQAPPSLIDVELTEDGLVPGYVPSKHEGLPRLAIYHPSFKVVEKQVTEVCNTFADAVLKLRGEGYTNPEIDTIMDKSISKYRSPCENYPQVKPVACFGPSGVGKSSAMNCMLNQRKAALEHDSDRGTYVVHEYVGPQYNQTALFEVHVPYLRRNQIKNLVSRHYSNIMDCLDRQADVDEDDSDELVMMLETGLDFFCAFLCDREEFKDRENAEDFFESRRSDREADVVDELMNYVHDFLEQRDLKENHEIFTAENEAELNEIFKLVSRPSRSKSGSDRGPQPSPWPLITKVQIRYDNHLLNTGVVLADTAGVTDSNTSVVSNTMQYIKRAGTVLIFASHKRIDKDPQVDRHLRECIQQGKMRNLILVVTQIDNKQVYKGMEKEDLPLAERALLDQAESHITALKVEETNLAKAKKGASDQEFRTIQDRLEQLELQKAAAQTALAQLSVEIRCRDIKEKLTGRLRKLEKSKKAPDLPIKFISSVAYQQHVAGYDPRVPPTLDIKATGIPELRLMLYDIPARGKISTLGRICRNILPNIFSGILGVLTKSKLERKEEVEKLINRVLKTQRLVVDDTFADVQRLFQARISKTIKDNEATWKTKAEKLLTEWANYKAATFSAFCRRSGHWKLPSQSTKQIFSWNALIQDIYGARLGAEFDLLDDNIDDAESTLVSELDSLFKTLKSSLEACDDFQGVDMQPFFTFIEQTGNELMARMTDVFAELKCELGEIRHCATLDTKLSYVAIAMQDTYVECLKMQAENYQTTHNRNRRVHRKPKAHTLRVDCVRDKLTGDTDQKGVFASVAHLADEKFQKELKLWDGKCRDVIAQGCAKVVDDFNRRYTVSEVKTEENASAVAELQQAARKALEVVEGSMKQHIEECDAWEAG